MTTADKRPILAITMGDPCGIGPEIVVDAASRASVRRACRLVVFGDEGVLDVARKARRVARAAGTAIVVSGLASSPLTHPATALLAATRLHSCGGASVETVLTSWIRRSAGCPACRSYVTPSPRFWLSILAPTCWW